MHGMNEDKKYCLTWHSHGANTVESFRTLLEDEHLSDVFFFAEGKLVKAHKVVLSSCSTYFQSLFKETIERQPIIVLKDVKLEHIKALLKFMYRGEVHIPQESLEPIMKIAQSLNIKGLADIGENIEKLEEPYQTPRSLSRPKIPHSYSTVPPTPPPPSVPHPQNINKINKPLHVNNVGNIYNPTTAQSVLSSALNNIPGVMNLPSSLTLPHLASLPHNLAYSLASSLPPNLVSSLASSLPPNLASSLVSTLNNVIPHSIPNFMSPRNMENREGADSPSAKKRRKQYSRRSREGLESADSDGRSSGSPGDNPNLHLPKIPATITPIALQKPHNVNPFLSSNIPQQHAKDLSMSSQNSSTTRLNVDRITEDFLREQRSQLSKLPNMGFPIMPPVTNINHKIQEEPENLEHRPKHEQNNSLNDEKAADENSPRNRRSQSPIRDHKSSPQTSADGSEGSSASVHHKPSPKLSSDPESASSPFKPMQSRNMDDTSSDTNHFSDDDKDVVDDRIAHSNQAGPSSTRPRSREATHTINTNALLGWPPMSEAKIEESLQNFSAESNPEYLRCLNLVRAAGFLPPRMPSASEIYSRSNVPINLPFLLKGNGDSSGPSLLQFPFPEPNKSFTCEKCGRGYASTGNLKRHKKYECGVEPQFSCPVCKKKFQHRHSVKIHVYSTHRENQREGAQDSVPMDPGRGHLLVPDAAALFSESAEMFSIPERRALFPNRDTLSVGPPSVGSNPWRLTPEQAATASQSHES